LKDSKYVNNSIIARDYNVVLFNNEKRGGNIIRDPFREKMEELITEWDLIDIKQIKGKYTWTNQRTGPGHISARLDIFLVHSDLLLQDYNFKSRILQSVVSNHKPIVLHFQDSADYGLLPFCSICYG
jgi:hypothetical protein